MTRSSRTFTFCSSSVDKVKSSTLGGLLKWLQSTQLSKLGCRRVLSLRHAKLLCWSW